MWGRTNSRCAGVVYDRCRAACILLVLSTLLAIQATIQFAVSQPLLATVETSTAGVAMRNAVSEDGLSVWYQVDQSLAFQRTLAAIPKNLLLNSEYNCPKQDPLLFQVNASPTLSTQSQAQRLQQLEQRWQRQINRLFREQQQRLQESGAMAAYRVRAISPLAARQDVPPVVINWPSESLKRQFSLCLTHGDNETIAKAPAVTLTLSLIGNQQHIQVELSVNAF
ncbi:hypothetical protein [Idiomarina xiamenensis]|uniref:Uncharacterized protein n=1 Tax=Idiomarina xiamenensis 10-D-4 TaxID=740709 RepID=K2KQY5_9GAMM|nr:hypothetical protein [Idiomarina xiamenensis]EKE79915.1 hypothetical protein A10D4_12448 [Idiomarina xiamenensis 10-D-4]